VKKWAVIPILLVLITGLIVSGCGGSPNGDGYRGGKPKVYTSIYPVYYLTSRIAGDTADVVEIVPPATDPHNWEPTPKQVAQLQSARIFIYNGAGLEAWAEKVASSLKETGVKVLELAAELDAEPLEGNKEHFQQNTDPHFWLDPVLAKQMALVIKNALVETDPENKAAYEENYLLLAKELEQLHRDYASTLSKCKKREFVVTHQAFGYLAKRYDLTQVPIMGISPECEPSPARLGELAQLLKEKNINYIFTEPLISPRVAKSLAEETGAEVLVLNPIGGLTEEQVKAGKDYLFLMRDNLEQLKVALEWNAKEKK